MITNTKNNYSVEIIEHSILGILIQNGSLFSAHVLRLRPEFFSIRETQMIYKVLLQLNRENLVIDTHLIFHFLNTMDNETDWKRIITKISVLENLKEKLPYFVRQLRENYMNEKLSQLAMNACDRNQLPEDRIQQGIDLLYELKDLSLQREEVLLGKLMQDFLQTGGIIDKKYLLTTGMKSLDAMLDGGFEQGQIAIIGGRPGMGKTALMTSFCNHWIKQKNKKVLFLSFHTNPKNFIQLLVANETGLAFKTLNDEGFKSDPEKAYLEELVRTEKENYLQYNYLRSNSIQELLAILYTKHSKHGVDIVVIDNLQQLDNGIAATTNRHQGLGQILKQLRQAAKDLNLLILMGSDLNRNVERRFSYSCRPQLADLKDSGFIEEIADKVLLLYRPDYYQLTEWEDGSPTQNEAELIIAKNTLGALGTVKVGYKQSSLNFYELASQDLYRSFAIPESRQNEFD